MYRTILVPVDGSPTASRGLGEAIALAKDQGSRLAILHVVEIPLDADPYVTMASSAEVLTLLREGGRAILARAAAAAKRAGVPASTVLLERPGRAAADLIVAQARKVRAGLIVIGTHGRRGLRRLVLGSDAEQVVRTAPVPVLLVRARETRTKRPR